MQFDVNWISHNTVTEQSNSYPPCNFLGINLHCHNLKYFVVRNILNLKHTRSCTSTPPVRQYHNQTNWGTHNEDRKFFWWFITINDQKWMKIRNTACARVSLLINLQFSRFTFTFSKPVWCLTMGGTTEPDVHNKDMSCCYTRHEPITVTFSAQALWYSQLQITSLCVRCKTTTLDISEYSRANGPTILTLPSQCHMVNHVKSTYNRRWSLSSEQIHSTVKQTHDLQMMITMG